MNFKISFWLLAPQSFLWRPPHSITPTELFDETYPTGVCGCMAWGIMIIDAVRGIAVTIDPGVPLGMNSWDTLPRPERAWWVQNSSPGPVLFSNVNFKDFRNLQKLDAKSEKDKDSERKIKDFRKLWFWCTWKDSRLTLAISPCSHGSAMPSSGIRKIMHFH